MSKPRSLSAIVSDGNAVDDGVLTVAAGTTNGLLFLNSSKQLTTNASLLFNAETGQLSATTFSGSASGLTGFKTVNGNDILGSGNIQIDGGVTSFNTRTGAVTLSSSDVTGALSYTPLNKTGDTITGNLTLSGGTANGVAYLNGSKVLTTGSALTFDGTNLGVTSGVTTLNQTVNGSAVLVTGTTGSAVNNYISLNHSPGGGAYSYTAIQIAGADIFSAGGNLSSYGGSAIVNSPGSTGGIIFRNYGTEGMRLTSTGLGIGASSPTNIQGDASKLLTYSSTAGTVSITSGGYVNSQYAQLYLSGGYGDNGFVSGHYIRSQASTPFGAASDATLQFFATVRGSSPSKLMELTSSGNLGLGVTPSAWGTGGNARAIQMGATAIYSFSDSRGELLTNAFHNGTNYIYRVNYPAVAYSQEANTGAHKWYTAPSGTAGNAISFTQTMTLDASGWLTIGTLAGSGDRPVSADANGKLIISGSDARLKEHISPITACLSKTLALNPVSFQWRDKASMGAKTNIGFIAQDVETVVPEVVGHTVEGMKTLDYAKLVALLTGAIQELKAELDSVKTAFNEYVSTHP